MTINTETLRSASKRNDVYKSAMQGLLAWAADHIDAQAAEIAESQGQIEHLDRRNNALRQSLGSMIHAYVRLLECGRDRILDLGGQCDPLDVLEANDPWLRDARAALSGDQS